MSIDRDAAESMRDYYARRALSYERIYHRPERQADLRAMEGWLASAFVGRDVLEIACGTGWWTPHGAAAAHSWLATDLNPETMEVAQAKAMPAGVDWAVVDADTLAGLDPVRRFDAAFAGFWWSHIALQRLPGWLALLHARLARPARVVFIDNRFVPGSSTPISRRDAAGNSYQMRRLDDGSEHEVVKNFPSRDEALLALGRHAIRCEWIPHHHYWILSYSLE